MGLYEKLTAEWWPEPKPIEVVVDDDRWETVDIGGMTASVHKRPDYEA